MFYRFCFFIIVLCSLSNTGLTQVVVSSIQLDKSLSLDGIVVGSDGTIYGADGWNGSSIFKIKRNGTSEVFVSGLAGPIDMDFDDKGNMYVSTFRDGNLYKITPQGEKSVFGKMNIGPSGVVLNRKQGTVYVSHFGSEIIRGNSIRQADSQGNVSVLVANNLLQSPVSLAIDNFGNLYSPNIANAKLFRITPAGELTILAGLPRSAGNYNIGHIAFANNQLYITGNSGKHYLYEVTLEGDYKIIAGNGQPGSMDGPGPEASFNGPNGIAASLDGDSLFITDLGNPSLIRVVVLNKPATGLENNRGRVDGFSLNPNFPNPFNPETTITYSVSATGRVKLSVFDFAGREVDTLVNTIQNAGKYEISFDASELASGVYFYRLSVEQKFQQTRKMILLR